MARHVCIHGHFYQPPREDPWLGQIVRQPSAHPYHDWNQRITAECYTPNTAARILDDKGHVAEVIDNYERISFDFGPTLLAWMEREAPATYRAVLDADRHSAARHGGIGAALAQAHGHLIMPLANPRDRRTQVVWGLRDFAHRFGRAARGIWLPETAVDLATLSLLAEHGVRFTILAPHQARRVRDGAGPWRPVDATSLDTSRPHRQRLPGEKTIDLFFYDAALSGGIAFGGLLHDGAALVGRLHDRAARGANPGLVHVATDGETYGHHHRFGDMALAWALRHIEDDPALELTHYAAFLEAHPPRGEVEIVENSSWSCAHGVERWRGDCGCGTDGPDHHGRWRAPLRETLDWLRDRLAVSFERGAGRLVRDPWAARDDAIDLLLVPRDATWETFLARHAVGPLDASRQDALWDWLALQRSAMAMFTSCGWFFDDVSRIETVQILQYAAHALQLARQLGGKDLEPELVRRLRDVPSAIADIRDGAALWHARVAPAIRPVPRRPAPLARRDGSRHG